MAASLSFFAGTNQLLGGSGLGFYGDAGWGASINTGTYQGHTYITNSAGNTQGAEGPNVEYLNSGSGILGQAGSGVSLTAIPNAQATLNVRFGYDSAVQVQSAYFTVYDGSDLANGPSGITYKVAEVIHPDVTQGNSGSGDTTWATPAGTGTTVGLAPSPGTSGLYAGNGSNSTYQDTQHDWYLVVSCSPNSIGAKLAQGYVYLEYL